MTHAEDGECKTSAVLCRSRHLPNLNWPLLQFPWRRSSQGEGRKVKINYSPQTQLVGRAGVKLWRIMGMKAGVEVIVSGFHSRRDFWFAPRASNALFSLSSGAVTTSFSSVVCVEQSAVKPAAEVTNCSCFLFWDIKPGQPRIQWSGPLATCCMERFQFCLSTTSRLTCLTHLSLAAPVPYRCMHKQQSAYAHVNIRGYGCHLLEILLKFTPSPSRFSLWCCSRLLYPHCCCEPMLSFTPAWLRAQLPIEPIATKAQPQSSYCIKKGIL